jgi:hypothetical protein
MVAAAGCSGRCPLVRLLVAVLLPLGAAAAGDDDSASASAPPTVQVNFAPPDIPVPAEPACVVPLFRRVFNDTVSHAWPYPDITKLCGGDRWAKVVLDLECGVTPGGQYDRSLFVFLKGVNVFAGTTEEPNHSDIGPSWKVQADLTHYGVGLLAGAGSGSVELDNIQSVGREALPHCSGALNFFKALSVPRYETHASSFVQFSCLVFCQDGLY